MVGLMTESELVTILEGMGYQAFWGPRPVAWDQNHCSDANWECYYCIQLNVIHQQVPT